MNLEEPMHDVAHLAHVELLTPKLEDSLRFFTDVMGMSRAAATEIRCICEAWDDYEHHSLQLTASEEPGLGHYALRAASAPALQRRVAALERSGLGLGWCDHNVGHGPAYRFTDPDRHVMEILLRDGMVPAIGGSTSCAEEPGFTLPAPRGRPAADR